MLAAGTAGGPVVDAANLTTFELVQTLHKARSPSLIRGIVHAAAVEEALRSMQLGRRALGTGLEVPQHSLCTTALPFLGRGAELASKVGASFVALCEWAHEHLYNLPLWHHMWSRAGSGTPPGQAVVSRNDYVGFHSHGPTLNALLASRVSSGAWDVSRANLVEINNVCDGGPALLAALRGARRVVAA